LRRTRKEPIIASFSEAPNQHRLVFPAALMSTIQELGAFLKREAMAAGDIPAAPALAPAPSNGSTPAK
jgi:hypothetical protein